VGAVAGSGGPLGVARRSIERAAEERLGGTELVDRVAPHLSRTVREAVASVARTWARWGVRAAVVGDPAFPGRLTAGWPESGGPLVLAWRGSGPPPQDGSSVAIVGARRATPYGSGVAAWLSESVARAGALVISGGAVGIDAAAHAAALEQPGGTLVVLGCGPDVAYPRQHARDGGLFDRVLDHGGWLVSELLPGTEPRPAMVVARNRIVAGLSDAVVVVEGSARSGALRTAACAADLGVPVLAVPGDVRAPGSAAPHRLLGEGAAPCASPHDLLAVLGRAAAQPGDGASTPTTSTLPGPVVAALARRWPRPVPADVLAEEAGISTGALLAALTRAQVAGEVVRAPDGIRLTRAP